MLPIERLEQELDVKITVTNLIAVAEFGPLDLDEVQRRAPGRVKYDPWMFPAAYYFGEYFTANIPSTGKVVLLGLRNFEQLWSAANELSRLLQRDYKSLKLTNICIVIDLKTSADLERLVHRNRLIYDPFVFPAAIGSKKLVFESGKVVVTGLKPETFEQTVRNIVSQIREVMNVGSS